MYLIFYYAHILFEIYFIKLPYENNQNTGAAYVASCDKQKRVYLKCYSLVSQALPGFKCSCAFSHRAF